MVAAGTYPRQIGNKGSESTAASPQRMDDIGFIGSLVSYLYISCYLRAIG